MYKRAIYLLLCSVFSHFLAAQDAAWWKDSASPKPGTGLQVIQPSAFRSLEIQVDLLQQMLYQAPHENEVLLAESNFLMDLPAPDGQTQTFRLVEYAMMEDGLAAKFPGIKTFIGKDIRRPQVLARLDLTPQGFHAMVMDGGNTWFIDPYFHLSNSDHYLSYFKKDYQKAHTFECLAEGSYESETTHQPESPEFVGEELRVYRLAMAATGEYTQFHGGTVDGALAAIVTTMNRVNGIYERDISARMVLIENNDLIIYTDGNSDPYSGSAGNHLGQNQSNLTAVIGTANYDIGHVVDTGGGGIAGLGVVCDSDDKARGYTGLGAPVGDPFDIDYVAHEIGHQFAGNHTFNGSAGSCGGGNRNGSTAYEPGSGVTIMAYAGICGSDNIANNSIDHFHVGSLVEMTNFTTIFNGNTCPEKIPTDNTAPVAEAGPSGYVIPISTPFELIASAVDLESDSLTYCWEQYDLGPSTGPNAPTGNAPSFRSFSPSTNPVRVFPRIADIINGTTTTGDVLPTYTRNLSFRVSVRDNVGFGGGVHWDQMTMSATELAGPFRVLSQNTATTWSAGSFQVIEWAVANTDQAPVNAAEVDILLSKDGGFTYPDTLAQNMPNIGLALIQIPDTLQGNTFRVKVKAANNVFFDINNANISITPAVAGFSLGVVNPNLVACGGQDFAVQLFSAAILGFDGEIALSVIDVPAGINVEVPPSIMPGTTSSFIVTGTGGLPSGLYDFSIVGQSGGLQDTVEIHLQLYAQAPGSIALVEPAANAQNVSVMPTLTWEAHPDAEQYDVQVSTVPDFSSILLEETGVNGIAYTPSLALEGNSTYYWRVRGSNSACGSGVYTERSFSTESILCQVFEPTDLPAPFSNNLPFLISRVTVDLDVPVRDVRVLNLRGTHFPISDLNFRFSSPEGPIIDLITEDCEFGNAFDVNLSDAASAAVPCPFNNGGTFHPEEPFSTYVGQSALGEWRIIIFKTEDNGELQSWGLELCYPAPVSQREQAIALARMKVFPNPAKERVQLQFDPGNQVHTIEVRNLAGEMVLQQMAKLDKGQMEFSLAAIPAGFYVVLAKDEAGSVIGSSKLIVTR
ncbi:MAG TPA: M12 family metallo-peptidase [Saprospiraceae bacterium]|nr:M12 family metallo-peptidase [Saprospiraceae bacterium]HMQ84899.1 M12 family metallo-peptidase [Saprospiraceae bacterium]